MKFISILFLAFLLTGCYTSSMMQTAKTLDKGEREFTIGAGPYTSYGDVLVSPEFMFRWGASDKSDFGLGYSLQLNGHVRADWKRELWSSPYGSSFLSSGGMFDIFLPNDFTGDPYYFGLCVPLYYSFNHNKKWVPYFGQRFSVGLGGLNIVKYAGLTDPLQENIHVYHSMFYSGAAGVRFGQKRIKWFLEASYNFHVEHSFRNYLYSYDNVEEWRISRGYYDNRSLQLTLGMTIGRKEG